VVTAGAGDGCAGDWIDPGEIGFGGFCGRSAAFKEQQPELIIHCAALSKSPVCQANPALARKLNVEVTALLAELAADIPFIFFSTDLVFDGNRGNYDEFDAVNPLSVYAETKVEAERIVLANPGHTVIRTSLNGGVSPTGDRGFNEELRRMMQEGHMLRLFVDEFRSPIAAAVTARAVWELVARNQPGLYHVAGGERLSRWQMGELLAARWPQLNPKNRAGDDKRIPGRAAFARLLAELCEGPKIIELSPALFEGLARGASGEIF